MNHARVMGWLVLSLGVTCLALGITFIDQPSPAEAQCGSQASSCRNCHEVNAEYPVNNVGDWHVDHAFGDFCQFCHLGNVQTTEFEAAHSGMTYPLANPAASCASCHPRQFEDLALTYGDILGIEVGTSVELGVRDVDNFDRNATAIAAPPPIGAKDVSLIDYNRRYRRDVLGEGDPPDWRNSVLAGIAVFVTGMTAMIVWRMERVGKRINELSETPFFAGDPDAHITPPEYIPGIDGPIKEQKDQDE